MDQISAHDHNTTVLFISKRADYYGGFYSPMWNKTTGMKQSAFFCRDTLRRNGIPSEMVIVGDNNDIDREVTKWRPRFVIIEALWVVPEKFKVLQRLHRDVTWIIRLHSEIPFLASESIAVDWLNQYADNHKLFISFNSDRMVEDVLSMVPRLAKQPWRVLYLPNCFILDKYRHLKRTPIRDGRIHVGCFGAIRPLKNQLIQAVSAIRTADSLRKELVFHLNSDRVEGRGDPAKRNIEALFQYADGHTLKWHPWAEHDDFINVVRSMDLGMQVSFTETFNHVAADYAALNVPMVVSHEIRWANWMFQASPTSVDDIVHKSRRALRLNRFGGQRLNRYGLSQHAAMAEEIWVDTFKYWR